jgi:hypothetical protein
MTGVAHSWSEANQQTLYPPNQEPSQMRSPVDVSARVSKRALLLVAAMVIGFVLVEQVSGLVNVIHHPVLGADYQAAANFVAAQHVPGEPVLIALPPPGYLALGERDDVVFLASSLEAKRAQRYTRRTADGRYVDFWLGVPAIVSTEQLCSAIAESPDLWLIVDESRLDYAWAFAGPMADAIRASTYEVYSGTGGISVRRPISGDLSASDSPCGQGNPTTGAH